MDKYKVIKRLFLIGIVMNAYFIYTNASKLIQLDMMNQTIIMKHRNFSKEMENRKNLLVESAKQ